MAINVTTEAALAGAYPAVHFGKREQKLIKILKTYIDENEVPGELTDAHIYVGNASDEATDVAVSGDLTLANTGAFTIANNAITTAKILAANVTLAKLAAGITPSHIVKFAGTFTTAGGDASESIPVVGALGTDTCVVTVKTAGGTPRSIVAAAAGTDAIAVTMSGDPSTDHVLQYQVFRAAA